MCSKACGGGTRMRTRTVVTPASGGGAACPPLTESEPCNTQSCDPVDCAVSDWGDWGACSKSCGGGVHTRKRTVVTQPANGGKACPDLSETEACNIQPCPVDCVPSKWSDWSECSKACGGGTRTRTRTVTTPASNGGKECGPLSESETCNPQPCDPPGGGGPGQGGNQN
jgi:hypothetical protein